MRLAATIALLLLAASPAAAELRDCEEAGLGLTSLAPGARNENIRHFYEGQVTMLLLDQEEPAAASMSVAFVFPSAGVDEPVYFQCMAATGYSGLDVAGADSRYDPARGLTLTIPAWRFDPETSDSQPVDPVVVTIDLGRGAIRMGE